MWIRYGMPIAAISVGLAASLVSYQVAFAARSRNYTPTEFRAVLRGFGYNVTPGNSLNDQATVAAIRQFQQGYRIPVDGVAGPQTQDLAADLVRILQANLNLVLRPSPALPRTQFYGSLTEAAVRRYQQQNNLPVTGIANLAVRKRIDDEATRILNNQPPAPSPQRTAPSPSPQAAPTPTTAPSPSPLRAPAPTTSPSPLTIPPAPSPQTRPRTITPSPSPQATPTPTSSPSR